ncbi:MAG: polysaccharide biosynthesis C-terminal domain-containing protein [Oscillospiraceae bacterium]|nr:polysaccharide biosynthesis C-terminal domain-containing protein [Oscillospiraceae bacterium]
MAVFVSKKDESFREYALNAPPMKVLFSVCAPLALYQALQQIFKILDALMASHISAEAVSAVSCLSQITLMITAIGSGLAVGGCIKVSEAYGRGDYDTVRTRVATLYGMVVLVGLLVVATLVPFAEGFLRLLQTPQDLIAEGTGYFRVEILSLVVTFFNTVYIAIERSRGHAKKILYLNLMIILVKLVLSALFVYVLKAGVAMIAAATLISQGVLLIYALYSMSRDEGAFRFSIRNLRLRKDTTLPILNLAYPVSAEKMLFAAGKVITNSMSGVYGGLTVGALGISNNIGGLTTGWHAGMLDGASALISQNRGAGHHRRTLQLYYRLIAIDMAIGVVGLALVATTLPWLAEVFARSEEAYDPEFCQMIISIHQWEMLGYITLGFNSATLALLLGYGYTKLTLLLNVARVFVFRVPVLWAFQNFTSLGAEAVGMTMMISNVCAGLSALAVAIPVVCRIHRMSDLK